MNNEEVKELKPCPFCGHKPEIKPGYYTFVRCPNCRASTETTIGNIKEDEIDNSAVNAAVIMWNNGFIYPVGEKLPYRLFRDLERISAS